MDYLICFLFRTHDWDGGNFQSVNPAININPKQQHTLHQNKDKAAANKKKRGMVE